MATPVPGRAYRCRGPRTTRERLSKYDACSGITNHGHKETSVAKRIQIAAVWAGPVFSFSTLSRSPASPGSSRRCAVVGSRQGRACHHRSRRPNPDGHGFGPDRHHTAVPILRGDLDSDTTHRETDADAGRDAIRGRCAAGGVLPALRDALDRSHFPLRAGTLHDPDARRPVPADLRDGVPRLCPAAVLYRVGVLHGSR
jgi:hypothetical protein